MTRLLHRYRPFTVRALALLAEEDGLERRRADAPCDARTGEEILGGLLAKLEAGASPPSSEGICED